VTARDIETGLARGGETCAQDLSQLAEVLALENGDRKSIDDPDAFLEEIGIDTEGLLEHQFRIAPEDYAAVTEDGGQVWKPTTEVIVADAVETVGRESLYVVKCSCECPEFAEWDRKFSTKFLASYPPIT